MPAGPHNRQTPRHDGSESRVCPICGNVGARVIYSFAKGKVVFAHRYCINNRHGRNWDKPTLADAIMASTSHR